MRKMFKYILPLLIFNILFFLFTPAALAIEPVSKGTLFDKFWKIGESAGYLTSGNEGIEDKLLLSAYLGNIVRIALSLLGVIFFALTIYGGFLWLYAGGNEEQVKKAKSIITRAVIGLVITLFAGGITQFVIYYFGR